MSRRRSQAPWAKQFGNKVTTHLEWLKDHAFGTRYPVGKHEQYLKAVTEYFNLERDVVCMQDWDGATE